MEEAQDQARTAVGVTADSVTRNWARRDKPEGRGRSSAETRVLRSRERGLPPIVAQFRAFCGAFAASRCRAEKRAARWLCWEAAANLSLQAIFPALPENTGSSMGFGPLGGTEPQHSQGIAGAIPRTRNREIFYANRECLLRQQASRLGFTLCALTLTNPRTTSWPA